MENTARQKTVLHTYRQTPTDRQKEQTELEGKEGGRRAETNRQALLQTGIITIRQVRLSTPILGRQELQLRKKRHAYKFMHF